MLLFGQDPVWGDASYGLPTGLHHVGAPVTTVGASELEHAGGEFPFP